jgi:integrase
MRGQFRHGNGTTLGGLYVWLAMVAGARRGELVALRWRDVELEAAVLTC